MTKRNASRYPGIRSFERSEQHLFFGRARETQALYEAVKVKPLTVLFSQSGIGKTSLLNAGLVPVLEQNAYLPIVIRLQDTSISPVETLQRVLSPYLDRQKLEQFGQQPYSLWEYVRACSFGERPVADSDTPVPAVPVLLFGRHPTPVEARHRLFDAAHAHWWIDRRASGTVDFHPAFASRSSAHRLTDDAASDLQLWLDNGSVELFADGGLSVMTSLFFPRQPWRRACPCDRAS